MGMCSPLPENLIQKTADHIDKAVDRQDLQTAQTIMNEVNSWRTSCNEQKNVFDHLGASKGDGTIQYRDTSTYRETEGGKVKEKDRGYLEFGNLY